MAKKKKKNSLKNYFLAGIFTVLPLAGTWVVVTWLARFLWARSEFVVYQVPLAVLQQVFPDALLKYAPYVATVIGLITVFMATVVIGLVARWIVGRTLLGWLEKILDTIPVVNWVYNVIRQIIGTFDPQSGQTKNFRKAMLVPLDAGGSIYAMAFLTNEVRFKSDGKIKDFYLCYLACNQMIQGYNVFIEKKRCIELDMPVEQAIQQVVSLGLVSPPDMKLLAPGVSKGGRSKPSVRKA